MKNIYMNYLYKYIYLRILEHRRKLIQFNCDIKPIQEGIYMALLLYNNDYNISCSILHYLNGHNYND